ncbi:MAG: A/G-specific adenine glycosylase [Candidatus Yanofskybacteria bacterium]|nr:A/G-specific adenine glycosylase [Candidatus Yanofskybacteria bacterium]
MNSATFRSMVMRYYRRHGRHDLPWRKRINPYRVLVSEIMLQQTQVPRVIEKYRAFLRAFPTFRALAGASTADVLKVWQGLGYNRRALMLQRCAQVIVREQSGALPADYDALRRLPGIGPYTAGAVLAFAFDAPRPVIETNIRRVYLHHFFPGRTNVGDDEILPLVTWDVARVVSAREWYGALMDYGTHLAGMVENPNRRSRRYVRQSSFTGSMRQIRGEVIRFLIERKNVTAAALTRRIRDPRLADALGALEREGFIARTGGRLMLAGE